MTKKERVQLAQWAMEYALKSGADQAAVSLNNRRDVDIEYRDKKLEKIKDSTQNGLSISIYAKKKYSSHSTNDLRKDALKKLIGEAVKSTAYLSEDEYRVLPDPELYPKGDFKDLDINDDAYANVDSEQRKKIAAAIEDATMARSDKIISSTAGYSDSHYNTVRVHSNGFTGESEGTVFSAGSEVTVNDPNGGRPEDYYYVTTRHFKDIPGPEEIGRQAARRALRKIGQKKIKSGKYTMLVENRVASRILGMFQSPLSARSLQQKSSYLDGMLGKKIASEKLTVIDDPFIPGGLGSRHFDGEGIAAKQRTIIDKGILKTFLIDNYYGRKLGEKPNGGSPANLVFAYGDRSFEEMTKSLDKGIVVVGFIGGNSNSTTGDFSFGIMGLYVENGQVVHPVNEMNISGNAKEFWNQLIEMGNDPYIYSSWRRPSMLFEDVHFSGL